MLLPTAQSVADVRIGPLLRLAVRATMLHDALVAGGKSVRMEVYEHGYHDLCLGPQARSGPIYPWRRRCSIRRWTHSKNRCSS